MTSVYIALLVFLVVVLAVLVGVWAYARWVKRDLDTAPTATTGVCTPVTLPPETVARLRELSAEPILLKQTAAGVRVQIEHRPMLPLMAFVGNDVSAALAQTAAMISEEWGPVWVALVTAVDDGVSAQRLS